MKEKKKKIISMSLIMFMLLTICVPNISAAKGTETIKLSSKKITLAVGKSRIIILKNVHKKVKWTVKNKKIIKIVERKGRYQNKIVVRGKKKGSTILMAKCGKKHYTVRVNVIKKNTEITTISEPAVIAETTTAQQIGGKEAETTSKDETMTAEQGETSTDEVTAEAKTEETTTKELITEPETTEIKEGVQMKIKHLGISYDYPDGGLKYLELEITNYDQQVHNIGYYSGKFEVYVNNKEQSGWQPCGLESEKNYLEEEELLQPQETVTKKVYIDWEDSDSRRFLTEGSYRYSYAIDKGELWVSDSFEICSVEE